jgi:hypothetical protein
MQVEVRALAISDLEENRMISERLLPIWSVYFSLKLEVPLTT